MTLYSVQQLPKGDAKGEETKKRKVYVKNDI